MKKVGKTTRPLKYDPNQIPYDYTMEVTNRFKGLDLIDRVPVWTEARTLYRRQGSRPSPRKRNVKRQNDCLRRPYKVAEKRRDTKGKEGKERHTHMKAELQRRARRDKAFLSEQCKK